MSEQNYRIRIKLGELELEAEGDKEFVEKHVEEFKKEIPEIAKKIPLKKEKTISEIPKETVELEKLSLGEFYKQKQPKGDVELALTIGYYIEHTERREEFTNREIKDEANSLGYTLTNPAHTLKEAAKGKKAYVRKTGKGKWKLTLEGKNLVEKKLPSPSEE